MFSSRVLIARLLCSDQRDVPILTALNVLRRRLGSKPTRQSAL